MKKIVFWIIIILWLNVLYQLSFSIYSLWQKQDVITLAQKNLEKSKKENENLKKEIVRAKTKTFIEEEARNKLFMIKNGEKTLIIPDNLIQVAKINSSDKSKDPNWKQWWSLFF